MKHARNAMTAHRAPDLSRVRSTQSSNLKCLLGWSRRKKFRKLCKSYVTNYRGDPRTSTTLSACCPPTSQTPKVRSCNPPTLSGCRLDFYRDRAQPLFVKLHRFLRVHKLQVTSAFCWRQWCDKTCKNCSRRHRRRSFEDFAT